MKWLKKFTVWLKKFISMTDENLKEFLPKGIELVEKVKKFVDSPTADAITEIIPGTWDNSLKSMGRALLPKLLLGLRNWNELIHISDENEKLKAIILEIGTGTGILTKEERNDLKTRLAASFNAEISGIPYDEVKLPTLTAYLHPEVLYEAA